jgi:hypothetical protein
MPRYDNFSGKLDSGSVRQGWQVRISINPSVLIENHRDSQIEKIKGILNRVLAKYIVNPKIAVMANEEDLNEGEYDGTTSRHGKAFDQRGKEICIYLPDTAKALSINNDYKTMLLTLWSELQKAGIPLMYMDVPGDQKIKGPSGFPTPFSLTSYSQREEWNDRHGILFKQFVAYDNDHPILKVQLTENDLRDYKIEFDRIEIARGRLEYFRAHQEPAIKRLQNDIRKIEAQPRSYKEVLYDGAIIGNIETKLSTYKEALKVINLQWPEDEDKRIKERGNLQKLFVEELSKDRVLQFLFNCHPHQADTSFSDHAAIDTLKKLYEVEVDQVADLIEQLRNDYQTKALEIKSDFDKHANGDNKTPETMFIDWSRYIPRYTYRCFPLIEKNPSQMQAIYRRIVLLEKESRAHEEFKKQWLKATYGNDKIYKQLAEFAKEVRCMENNQLHNIDPNVLTKFQELYNKIEDEIFSHKKCNIDNTPYPVVINHFKTMANAINLGTKFSEQDMTDSSNILDKKLVDKKPMSKGLKAAICGVIGAVVGAIIGLAVGAALTGGFGAIPAAIACGAAGFTLAQGLVVGGTALGVGAAGGVIGARIGFLSARRNNATYDQDKDAIKPAIDDFFAPRR